MGKIHEGFHFLGLCFKRTQTLQNCSKTKPRTAVSLHKRCYHRALEKVKLMQASAGSPEKVQSYLRRWARWWAKMHGDIGYEDVMGAWRGGGGGRASNIACPPATG